MGRWIAVAALLAMCVALPAWADDRMDCNGNNTVGLLKTEPGRVATACRRLAEQGDAFAEAQLGRLYYNGQGVAKDHAVAAGWFRKAADQGTDGGGAALMLGLLYWGGEGVPVDYVQAYKWLSLSMDEGPSIAAAPSRDRLADDMTPTQIAQAKALAAAWKPTPGH